MRKATKYLDFDFSTISVKDASGECIIEGYANTRTKDRVGDVVLPSAFESSLKTYMDNAVLLEGHDWNKVAGVTQNAEITDKGLFIRARISDTRPDLKTLVREGCLKTFSIGYNEKDADFDEATKTKIVKDLELLEISIVTVPANPEAKFGVVSEEKKPVYGGDATDVANEHAANTEENAEQARDERSEEENSKSAPLNKQAAKSAKDLKSFIDTVKEVCGGDLGDQTIIAICDYFNLNEETMTKDELIKLLREKVKSTDPVTGKADDKPADGGAPAEEPKPADAGAQGDAGKVLDAILAKLGQLADGVAQLLEMEQEEAQEDAAEDNQEAAPAADEAQKSDEELQKELDAVNAAIETELASQ